MEATSFVSQQLVGLVVYILFALCIDLCGADYVMLPPLPMYLYSHTQETHASSLRPILHFDSLSCCCRMWTQNRKFSSATKRAMTANCLRPQI